MTQIEALKELESVAEGLQKALEEIRTLIAAEESPPKPKLIGGPMREAPEIGVEYWYIDNMNEVYVGRWQNHQLDNRRLDTGNLFATQEDAEFAAKKRNIFAHPIGEWGPEGSPWAINPHGNLWEMLDVTLYGFACRLWLNGELAFDDDGKAELERRIAAWKELCKEYGIA